MTNFDDTLRQRARDLYVVCSDNEIEIDDDAQISESDEGFWVSAWVYVPKEELG